MTTSAPSSLTIIGAGPGGYTAAFRAADLGLKVTLIDENAALGGTCLNHGCIPSKTLLHAGHIITNSADAKAIGLDFNAPHLDIDRLRSWKNNVIRKLNAGIAQLAKARHITCIQGKASFLNNSLLQVETPDGTCRPMPFEQALIATGACPVRLACLPQSNRVWDSAGALQLSHIPPTLLVIGGGYIGLELATAYAALGSRVSIIDTMPSLLPFADKDLTGILLRRLQKTCAEIVCAATITHATETPDGISVAWQDASGHSRQESYSQILVCTGRKPNTSGLGLENTAVQITSKGAILVDGQRRTSERNIFAIGDITEGPMLAHKAAFEAKVAAQAAAGHAACYEPKCIPSVIFTDPELAWCGLTEEEACRNGIDTAVARFPWSASGRAITLNRPDGMTKIIADKKTGRVLGVGICGINAGDLIAQGAMAIETGMNVKDLEKTIHAHPTLPETLLEAAEGIFGRPTHIIPSGK